MSIVQQNFDFDGRKMTGSKCGEHNTITLHVYCIIFVTVIFFMDMLGILNSHTLEFCLDGTKINGENNT